NRIHIVDLIGAKQQTSIEKNYIKHLRTLTNKPMEVGGGIRSHETIDAYLADGIDYCIIGTKGIQDMDWLTEMAHEYQNQLYLSVVDYHREVQIYGRYHDAIIGLFVYDK